MIGNLSLSISLTILSGVFAVGGINVDKNNNQHNTFPPSLFASTTNLMIADTALSGKVAGNFWLSFDYSTENPENNVWLYRGGNRSETYSELLFDDMLSEFNSYNDSVAMIRCDTGIRVIDSTNYITYDFTILWRTYTFNRENEVLWRYNDTFGFLMDNDLLNTDDPDNYIKEYYVKFGLNQVDLEYNQEYQYSPHIFGEGFGYSGLLYTFDIVVTIPLLDNGMGFYFYACCSDYTGNTIAYNNGYNDGYNVGYNDGSYQGYLVGYSEGLNVSSNASFTSLMNSIADTPLRFLYGIFNFDLFGVSMLVIILSLLTFSITFALVKKIWH